MNDETLRLLEYDRMKELFAPKMACELGRSLLEELSPSRSAEVVRRGLEEAKEAAALADLGRRLPMGGVHDLRPMLDEVHDRGRPLEPEELNRARETLEGARNLVVAVRDAAREEDVEFPRLGALADDIPGFTLLTDRIAEVVDGRGRVRDEASPRLSETRRSIRALRSRIEGKVAKLLARRDLKNALRETTLRFRSGRVVLAVKADRRGDLRGVLHDVSQSGATCFVEPEEVVPEGNSLEDLLAAERREVTRVLWETTVQVLAVEQDLRLAQAAMARMDLAQGVAAAAAEHGLVFPTLNRDGVQRFRRARHPVLQLLSGREAVVPVDLRLGDDFFLLVITGPNTGGKTVSLKTLGLLTLMVQSGLPVPAEEAESSLIDEVFVDIGDEQSLEQSLSTFSSHVSRIARFLATAGKRTLVLLDELGSGTDPAEGAALGRAILDFLHSRRVPSVVTTHLGALKTYAYTHRGVSNASVEFDVETLSPTFRLIMGQPGASNALTIADRLGMPGEVVARARDLVDPGDRASQEILEKAQEIRSEAERNLRESDDLRAETRELRDRAEEEYQDAERRKRHVEKEAEDEMDRALGRVRQLLREYGKTLQNAPKPFSETAREMLARAEEEIRATPLIRRREEFALSLKRGDEVYVPQFGERLRVHGIRKKDRVLTLIRGNMRIEVHFEDVTFAPEA